MAAYYGELRRKYERASADPAQPVSPDPPAPPWESPFEPSIWHIHINQARILAQCEELIRRYPDLIEAHERRAWILATCPDSRLRDGKLAVAEATRAAELTNAQEEGAVIIGEELFATLAAAYAEAGDFASAVRWEQRQLEEDVAVPRSSTSR
jgi:hypothetical protein